jgi:hypothetical protein
VLSAGGALGSRLAHSASPRSAGVGRASVALAQRLRRNRGEPGCIAGVAVWMVLVKAGDGPLEGGDAVDQLGEAVAAQAATLEASVAAGAEPSVVVSVEALDGRRPGRSRRGLSAPGSSRSVGPVGRWR